MELGSLCLITSRDASLVLPVRGHKNRKFVGQTGIIMNKNAAHPHSSCTKAWYVVFIQGSISHIREDAMEEI
jgi:hypothetical protein